MDEETTRINIKELMCIALNAENYYKKLMEETNTQKGDPLYTLTALTILSVYRNTPNIEIKDTLLYLYKETIKAIINQDETFLNKIKDMIIKNK